MNKRIMATFSLFSGLALVFLLFAPFGQTATSDYPTRPIEVVVHTNPGGMVDIAIRIVNSKVQEILGVPLIIANKAAGSGAQGIEAVVKAKPDGYTILGGSDTAVVPIPLMNPEVSFRYNSLLPIAWAAVGGSVIIVPQNSPFKTFQELLDYARKNPGKLTYGSTGASHSVRVTMELIKKAAGVDIVHVPYQGGGPLAAAIAGGHVDVANNSLSAVYSLIKAGNLRALAVVTKNRNPEFPEVPTLTELGFARATLSSRAGYLAPLGTPKAIIDRWNEVVQKALSDPGVKEKMASNFLTIDYEPPEAMAKSLEELNQIYVDFLKEVGLTKK